MKLPNGFGTVYRMKGDRRRPFVVKKTIEGRQKILGYFDTFEHGLSFLVDVNRDPSAFSDNITFKELYARGRCKNFRTCRHPAEKDMKIHTGIASRCTIWPFLRSASATFRASSIP